MTVYSQRGWILARIRLQERQEIDKLVPEDLTTHEKIAKLIEIAKGFSREVGSSRSEGPRIVTPPCVAPDKLVSSPEEPGKNLDPCKMMDSVNLRCLRASPNRIFKIDHEICEACQFRGLHYPPDLNGLTPNEENKITRELEITKERREIAELKLETERAKGEREPERIRVLYKDHKW